MDVNRLACSLEMYLGEDVLRMKTGDLMPVQWKGYMSGIQAYQGEILDKTDVNNSSLDNIGMHSVRAECTLASITQLTIYRKHASPVVSSLF
jgi:hypothetical protein